MISIGLIRDARQTIQFRKKPGNVGTGTCEEIKRA
jgi:hypothetical protein